MAKMKPGSQFSTRPRRTRRSSQDIINLIIEAAIREFEQFGYLGATRASIAKLADVTEAQIFRLFGSKRNLFRSAIFKPLNQHLLAFLQIGGARNNSDVCIRDSTRSYIGALQDFTETHSAMLTSLVVAADYSLDSDKGVSEIEGLESYFERGASLMIKRFGAELRVNPTLMVRVSFAAVLGNIVFKNWLFPSGEVQEESIRDAITNFVFHGLRVNQDLPQVARDENA